MCLEKGNFKGTQRCTNPFVADWEWHLEKEVASSHFAGLAQLKISACTLCCLPTVLDLSCRCEILVWRTQQGWDRQSFYVGSRFWDWRSCVCARSAYREGLWNVHVLPPVPQFHAFSWTFVRVLIFKIRLTCMWGRDGEGQAVRSSLAMLHPPMENGGTEFVGVTGVHAGSNRTNLISWMWYY